MASVKPYRNGYRAQVYVHGVRDSKTFRTKREADAWGAAREAEIERDAGKPPSAKFTLAQAMRQYSEAVSPKKRGARWEKIRIEALLEQGVFPGGLPIGEVSTAHLAAWRDARLRAVSAGTVLREVSLISAIFEQARREWRWIESNPVNDLKKPRTPDHRDVVISRHQIRRQLQAMGWRSGPCRGMTQAAGRAFVLALRTGMRAGEICALRWDQVRGDYCAKVGTKTRPRDVGLTAQARRLIESMRGFDEVLVFGISPQTLDAIFRRCRDRAGLSGFTFHDARHTAATWIAQRLDVLDLCKLFGWANPKQAMAYYNPTASEIARRMARPPGRR